MNPDVAPAGSNVFGAAVDWVQITLLGSLATTVAIIAVVVLGLLLLSGRFPRRRAVEVILGCFITFGASTIARGLIGVLGGSTSSQDLVAPQAVVFNPRPVAVQPPVASVPYDPYAGAALPSRP